MKNVRIVVLLVAAGLSLLVLFAERRITPYRRAESYADMERAARLMAEAERAVREARIGSGYPIDTVHDPNGTGLIGVEYSETTTSLGELEAKRTTTNPDMAALMVRLFVKAGVRRGDAIAVGASGSFPALTLATLSAARTLDLDVALIVSLGASTWGANIPEFSYLRMHEAARPVLGYDVAAVSLGGGEDSGGDMADEGRRLLSSAMARSGLYLIDAGTTAEAVTKRMIVYDGFFYGKRCSAFVNIGGASANVGDGLTVLELAPGLNAGVPVPSHDDTGVIYKMGERGIPVIHLLNIRTLALDAGVPWDPVPFPDIGTSRVYKEYDKAEYRRRLFGLTLAYFSLLAVLGFLYRRAGTPR